jgi:ribosome-associated toxin RatA of RatAB toxin-antitoxin module
MLKRIFLIFMLALSLPALADDSIAPALTPTLALKVERIDGDDGGKVYQIASSGEVAASPATVWRILTDYNHMADYVPDLKSARVVSRTGDKVLLEQHGAARLLFFSKDIRIVVEVHEQSPNKIDVSLVDGDMKVYRCSWELDPLGATGGTRVLYKATIEPKFYVPGVVGTSLVRKDIARMMKAVLARLDRPE